MEEKPERAASAAAAKPARTGKTSKTGAASKTGSSKRTAKKPAKASEAAMRLTKAEKELVKNYRKCSAIEKKFIAAAAEKAAGGMDLNSILGILKTIF